MRKLRMIILAILLISTMCLVPACQTGGQEEAIEEGSSAIEEEPPVSNEKKVPSEYDDGQEFSTELFSTPIAESVNTSGVVIPKEEFLYDLLIRYIGFCDTEYDANEPVKEDRCNIMASIASDDLINADTYQMAGYHETKEGTDDPRGWSKEYGDLGNGEYGYYCADRDATDWLAENIFNLSADGIKEAVKDAESKHKLYKDGDKYYGFLIRMGLSNPGPIEIRECKMDGNVYYMAIDYVFPEETTAYVKAELKNIDGIWYWTLHSFSEDRLAELS